MQPKNKKQFTYLLSGLFFALVAFALLGGSEVKAAANTCDSLSYTVDGGQLRIEGSDCDRGQDWEWTHERTVSGEWDGESQVGHEFVPGEEQIPSSLWVNPDSLGQAGTETGFGTEVEPLSSTISNTGEADTFFAEGGDQDADAEEGQQECEAGSFIELMMCNVLTTTLNGLESFQTTMVEVLFQQDPLLASDEDDNIYKMWSNIRNIANSLLVLAFMFIIFSLAFSVNIDAYTIKRIVPKLLIATISIQASFLISASMVDVTNILGQGLGALSDIALSDFDVIDDFGGSEAAGTGVAGLVLAGVASVAVAAALASGVGLLGVILFFIVGLFLVVMGALLIVALREVFILMFIVLSPIAFLANLLPATERWFKFWWSNFTRILLMYPFIILMIQFGNLASYLVITREGTIEGFLGPFLALLMQMVAFLSIFFAFKVGGSVMNLATKGITNAARKSRKSASENMQSMNPFRKAIGNIQSGRSKIKSGDVDDINLQRAGNPLGQGARAVGRSGLAGKRAMTAATASEGAQEATRTRVMNETKEELEKLGIDEEAWIRLAPVIGDKSKFNKELADLQEEIERHASRAQSYRSSGQLEEAEAEDSNVNKKQDILKKASRIDRNMVGSVSSAGAAAQLITSQGYLGDQELPSGERVGAEERVGKVFNNLEAAYGSNSPIVQQAKLEAFKNANKNGRQDIATKLHPSPAQTPDKTVSAMSAKDYIETKPKTLESSEIKGALKRQLTERDDSGNYAHGGTRTAIATALPNMSADKRNAIYEMVGDNEFRELEAMSRSQQNTPQQQGPQQGS